MNIESVDILSALYSGMVSHTDAAAEQIVADNNFSSQIKEMAAANIKTDIFKKFGVKVNAPDDSETCLIPEDLLYRMNSDAALKEKVYSVLADHKNAKAALASFYPPVKHYTLVFDKKGDVVTYVLEPDMERLEKDMGKSGRVKNYLFDGSFINPYDYLELVSGSSCNPYQGVEAQQAFLAAALLKKQRLTD